MIITINDYTIPNIYKGVTYKESLDDELKTLTVIYKDTIKPAFKPYDIAIVDNIKWLVGNINFQLIARAENKHTYKITLTLIELTKILERYILSPCSFTNKNDTLDTQIIKAIEQAEPLRLGEISRFDIFQGMLYAKTMNIIGEEFFFNKQSTLREVLDEMLSILNYRVTVFDVVSDLSKIYLGYLDLNQQSIDIKPINNIVGENASHNMEYLASDYITNVKNALSRDRKIMTEEWSTVKPILGTLADSNNVRLITSNPIECTTKVLTKLEVNIKHTQTDDTGALLAHTEVWDYGIHIVCDLTANFVEQEIYDTLSITEQEKLIPYKRGSKDIGVLSTYKMLFLTRPKLNEMLASLSIAASQTALIAAGKWRNNDTIVSVYIPDSGQIYERILFQISYVPYLDLLYSQSKENVNLPYKSTLISNQSEQTVDITRYGNSLRALANKYGSEMLELDVVCDNTYNLLSLGDRIEGNYTLISREYSIFNKVKSHYIFAQNYSSSLTTRMSRERRLYNIPINESIERTVLIKDNLLLSTTPISINNGVLNDEVTIPYLLKTFDNTGDANTPIDRILISTVDKNATEYRAFSMPLLKNAVANNIVYQFAFYDNYSVGLSTGSRVIGGKTVYQNPYVDSNGEFVYIKIQLINSNINAASFETQLIIGNALPIIPEQIIPLYTRVAFSNAISYKIQKDSFEKIGMSYQLGIKPNVVGDIVVGDYFTKYCNILNGKNETQLYIYTSLTDTYKTWETKICKGDKTVNYPKIDIANIRVYIDTIDLTTVTSWAIGDNNGNLVLGVNNNKTNLDSVYFTISRN